MADGGKPKFHHIDIVLRHMVDVIGVVADGGDLTTLDEIWPKMCSK